MAGRVEMVEYGEASLSALEAAIVEAKGADVLAPVAVVASSPRTAARLRQRLALSSGYANLRVVVADDVAADLVEADLVASGRRRLTRTVLLGAIRAVLAAGSSRLSAVATHPATVVRIAERYEQLRAIGLDDASTGHGTGVLADVGAVAVAVRRLLSTSWFDDVDVLDAAVDAASAGQAAGDGQAYEPLVVYLPEQPSRRALGLFAALSSTVPVVVLLGTVGDPAADGVVRTVLAQLLDLGFAATGDESPRPAVPASDARSPLGFHEILEAPDAVSETRGAVRLLLEHAETGGSLGRCAVLYAQSAPYRSLLAEVLDATGIPWSGPPARIVGELPAARLVSGLASLVAAGPVVGRRELVAWLSSAPVVDASGDVASVAEWDRCSRLAGIVAGTPRELADRLRRHGDGLATALAARHASAAEPGLSLARGPSGTPESSRTSRDWRTAEACAGLAELLDRLGESAARAARATSWQDLATWAAEAVECFLGSRDPAAPERAPDERASVVELLDELATLDSVDPVASLASFEAAFIAGCERPARRSAVPATSLVVGPLEAAAGLDFDLVLLLGAVEGSLPARVGTDPLDDRDDVRGGQPGRAWGGADESNLVERDRRRVLASLAGARRRVVSVPHRDGATGRPLRRSRFVPAPGDVVAGGDAGPPAPVHGRLPTFAEAVARVAAGHLAAMDRTELECAVLTVPVDGPPGRVARARAERMGEVGLARGLGVVDERRARAFGRFGGDVGSGAAGNGASDLLAGQGLLSPTGLETFATCPFRYYLADLLGLEALEVPEERLGIDPRDRGSMVHEILERFVGELTDTGARPGPAAAAPAGSRARLEEISDGVFSRYEQRGLTGKTALWDIERARVRAWLEAERQADERRRGAGRLPVAVEKEFGSGDVPAVVRDACGRTFSFRGKIDRVDRDQDDRVIVVDYKTGSSRRYEGLRSDCVDRGRHLQLPLYALAARDSLGMRGDVSAEFRFVGDDATVFQFELGDDGLRRLDEVLAALVGSISAGAFPPRPGAPSFGGYEHCGRCDFDKLCPTERAELWDSARLSPALSRYVDLVEGGDDRA